MSDRELMQQALEALEQSVSTCFDQYSHHEVMSRPEHFMNRAMKALRERLAQPEQEPVAWMYHGISHDDRPHDRPSLIFKPEYMDSMSESKGAQAVPLYTAPRQWQGLTEDEARALGKQYYHSPVSLMYAVEAKLKEKNT